MSGKLAERATKASDAAGLNRITLHEPATGTRRCSWPRLLADRPHGATSSRAPETRPGGRSGGHKCQPGGRSWGSFGVARPAGESARSWLYSADLAVGCGCRRRDSNPRTRIMIPRRFGSTARFAAAGGHDRGHNRVPLAARTSHAYRRALHRGLDGGSVRQAVIEMASSLRDRVAQRSRV